MLLASVQYRNLFNRRALQHHRGGSTSLSRKFALRRVSSKPNDPRLSDLGHVIEDDYAAVRNSYRTPKNAIVLAHGLLGFDELHVAGSYLPGVHYWRGIAEALSTNGIEVITSSVPASASIEERARKLSANILKKAGGKSVNIIAHSMVLGPVDYFSSSSPVHRGMIHLIEAKRDGMIIEARGLDSRYMISQLKPPNVDVLSLTTIATPHRGSAFADYLFDRIGSERLPKLYRALQSFGVDTGAFSQLTRRYMQEDFNPRTPDRDETRYFSYGATIKPSLWSAFRASHRIIEAEEGLNDGLVSVKSSRWGGEGGYKGTLSGVNHLDLINWTNRLRWLLWELGGNKRRFNAVAFYLSIADMLAKEGF